MARMAVPKITLGRPVVVAQAPPDITRWGPWQFPSIERLADGRLHVEFHIEADSATAYGLPHAHALSADGGQTWSMVTDVPSPGGLLLPNGDRLRPVVMRPRKSAGLYLPKAAHVYAYPGTHGITFTYYRAADLPAELLDGWRLARLPAGQSDWQEEQATVRMPGEVRVVTEDEYVYPFFLADRMRVAPDGSLWNVDWFGKRMVDGKVQDYYNALFLRSGDQGHSWDLVGELLYGPGQVDPAADPRWADRYGFDEPEFNFMPDGSIFCLTRITDGLGVGPMYAARSVDGSQTWSRPRVFDDCGVWPQLLTLGNGITLAAYGRPGFYVRATADPSGQTWGDRAVAVPPGQVGKDTCSYGDLIALDDHMALVVYSDFGFPNGQGQSCKTILVRTVTVA